MYIYIYIFPYYIYIITLNQNLCSTSPSERSCCHHLHDDFPTSQFAHHPLERQTHGSMLGFVALRTVDAAHCCCRRHGVPRNLNVTAWQFRHPRIRAPRRESAVQRVFSGISEKKTFKKLQTSSRSKKHVPRSSLLHPLESPQKRPWSSGSVEPLAAPRGPPRHAARRPRSQFDASRRRWPRKRSGWPKERNGTGESQTTTDSAANTLWINNMEYD